MDANIVFDMVNHLNKNSVIFSSIDGGAREIPIYGYNGLG